MRVTLLRYSQEYEAPTSPLHQSMCHTSAGTWTEGLEPVPQQITPSRDPLVTGVVIAVIAAVLFGFVHFKRMVKNLPQDLWGIRRRENAFDDQAPHEFRSLLFLIVQLLVCETLLTYLWFRPQVGSFTDVNTVLGLLFLLMTGYYVFRIAAYTAVGWIFAEGNGFMLWLRGFNSVSALLSIFLLIPAVVALFYPTATREMIIFSIFCCFFARFIFILKGFRIFYRNILSLIYFILYLCALEIIPVILVYAEAQILCGHSVR